MTPTATATAQVIPRRVLTRTAAWTVPVIAASAAAPAWAVSICDGRRTVGTTSGTAGANNTIIADSASPAPGYTRGSATSATWTTNDPDGATSLYTFATIAVTEERTTSNGTINIQYGFATNDTQNLALFNTGTVIGPSINQRPTSATSPRGFGNRTITTFTFDRTVYGLTFTISDISKSAQPEIVASAGQLTSVAFWDAVFVESADTWSWSARGTAVEGAGTQASPFTAAIGAPNADQNAQSDVTINFFGGVTQFKIHYWSADKVANANDTGGGQGITVSNMTMQVAPTGCP